MARVYGADGFRRIASAHVCVVGLGGVGSWAAEVLARSGVGGLTLIDLDHVAESNLNRQVLALESTLGAAKVDAMAQRIAQIAPECRVDRVDAFVDAENAQTLLPEDALVIDAVDDVRAKAAMVALARQRGQWIVVCGAAGGRTDPLRLRQDDLARTRGDALLASVRTRLRREYGFARGGGGPANAASSGSPRGGSRAATRQGLAPKFGVTAIFSDEPLRGVAVQQGGAGLACAGYGSLATVTAAMGLAAAAMALERAQAG